MTYRIMCKRSKCDNVVFGDGVMDEIIDLIHSDSKDLIFERENIVTSHPHGLLMRGVSKMCGERLNNELSCGVHYRIYDSAEKELLHAMISYGEGEYSRTKFEVYYHNMPALDYEMWWWKNEDPELVSDTLTFFGELRKNQHKFKDYVVVFDFDDYFNTPKEFRRRKTVYPLPVVRGCSLWARVGERRAMRQVKNLPINQK